MSVFHFFRALSHYVMVGKADIVAAKHRGLVQAHGIR